MTDIAKILKDAPKNLKLYSLVHGYVTLVNADADENITFQIQLKDIYDNYFYFTKNGFYFRDYDNAECVLFPSKEHKSWDNWQSVLFQKGNIIKHKSSQYKEEVNIQTDIYVYDGYDKSSKEYY